MTDSPPLISDVVSNGGEDTSSQSPRRSLPSRWASVVRGDSEQNSSPIAAAVSVAPGSSLSPPPEQTSALDNTLIEGSGAEVQPESSDVNDDSNAGRPRRPAWNRPSNGVVEPASVMGGAVSWPALSETTRPVVRPSSDNPRPVSDGSASSSEAAVVSQPPQQPACDNAHANSAVNNPMPTRPRSRNRGGGSSSGSGPSQNNFNHPPFQMPPPFPVFEVRYGMVPAVIDTSVRGPRPVGGSQSHASNDHSQRNNSRRGGCGPRPRGDGPYHNNYGGRRDQGRRDFHHPPQYVPPPMGYIPSPMSPGVPFVAPPPVRPFPGQMFDMASPFIYVPPMPPEPFRQMPIVPPPPPILFSHANENTLKNMIVKQIDFYFSDDNLVKDNFLRSRMDDHGWVPITLIASFRRVKQLTKDIPVILESLRYSSVVEVQGDKVRRCNEWKKWLLLSSSPNSDSGFQTPTAPENELAASLQEASLNDTMTNVNGSRDATEGHTEMATGRFLPEELTGQPRLANGEDTAEEVHTISV